MDRSPPGDDHRLTESLERMTFRVHPASFALVGIPGPPQPVDVSWITPPGQVIVEPDETTLLVRSDQLDELRSRHPAAAASPIEDDLAWIRFDAPMAWDVVGFLALVTGRLAAAGIPIGAICGFSRDHLFVARRFADRARAELGQLCPEAPDGP